MSPDFFLEERRYQITVLLQENGRASVSELSKRFGVSEVTVRSDLNALEKIGLIRRTHGGAILNANGSELADLALSRRLEKHIEEKNRIGEAGAEQIASGETVFLDSSSTALSIARLLKDHIDLTVITNSLAVAHELLPFRRIDVILLGGVLHRDTQSLVNGLGWKQLGKFTLQKGFFGAHGLTLHEGLTDISASEAEVKCKVLPLCQQVYCVIDSTKWGRAGLTSFAHIEQLNCVISDTNSPPELVEKLTAKGIQVILV